MTLQAVREQPIAAERIEGVRAGWIVGRSNPPGGLLVDYPGSHGGPQRAESLVNLEGTALTQAIENRTKVLLAFLDGDATQPVVLGILQPPAETRTAPPASPPDEVVVRLPEGAKENQQEAQIDGRRVVLEGHEQIVLRCGAASIELRRDGKLIIRGAHVITHAEGVNRIRGGSVQIN